MSFEDLERAAATYYSGTLAAHGPTPRGVDWNSVESQERRFAALLHVVGDRDEFSVNDFGCGYGALVDWLDVRGARVRYTGYDVSGTMLEAAAARCAERPWCRFVSDVQALESADFTIASGIFNVKGDAPTARWSAYMSETVDRIASVSSVGFTFNALTSYADADRMRDDLHYADPREWFDICARRFNRLGVALLQDYGLFEFTIAVRCAADADPGAWS
jgi:SAM-dependent methyltransferase